MAFDCPDLLDAVTAWSSAHLAIHYPNFQDISLQLQGRALSGLSASIKGNSLSREMCVAVAMVMCSMSSISDATGGTWLHHLSGAAAALQGNRSQQNRLSQKRREGQGGPLSFLQSFEGKWLLRNFAYHDVLMSVSLDRRPLLTGDYWMSADDALADPYFAFASRILFFISEISVLKADWAEEQECHFGQGSVSALSPDQAWGNTHSVLVERSLVLGQNLRDWTCPDTVSPESPLTLLSEAYRSAALICLSRTLRKYAPEEVDEAVPEGVQHHVASICEIAENIPEGALAECTFLFPLFIAGGEADHVDHIAVVKSRLSTMNRWRKFRNVEACKEVLEEVWRRRSEGAMGKDAEKVDWLDIAQYRGWQLALT